MASDQGQSPAAHFPWPLAPHVTTADQSPDDAPADDFERPVIKRTVPAADAPRINASAVNSPFNWRGTTTTPPPTHQERGPVMAANRTSVKEALRRDMQRIVCTLLASRPDITGKTIGEETGLQGRQLQNTLYSIQRCGRAKRDEANCFRLTKAGAEWVATFNSDGTQTPTQATKRVKPIVVDVQQRDSAPHSHSDRHEVLSAQPSFRCAVFSDGSFTLSKEGDVIELSAQERAEMQRYLERMSTYAHPELG